MKLKIVLLSLALLGTTGIANAAQKGEEIQEIDLRAVGGPVYYLGCSGDALPQCGILSIWQEDNLKPGLQKRPSSGAASFGKDLKLTL